MERIKLFDAIDEMRKISAVGGTFSFKFRKWDRQRRTGGEAVKINNARVRPAASDEKIENASHKLFFTDTDTGRAMVCWQPLIIEFNEKQIML